MATGSIGSGWQNIQNPLSLSCSMGTYEYPSGTITFNNIASGAEWWYNAAGTKNETMAVYLCDSSGGNAYKLFDVTWNNECTNTTTKTATGMSCPGLKGKSLYIKGVLPNNPSYAYLRGSGTSVSIGTATESVTCTVTSSSTSMGTVSGGGSHTPGVAVNISASAKTGYHFTGWSVTSGSGSFGNASSASTTFTSTGNATVKASFAINSYTLSTTVSPSGGGSVTAGATLNYNATKSLTATAASGYQFSSWSKTAGSLSSTTSNPTTFTMGTSNATVTANFSKKSYAITVSTSPAAGGTATGGGTYTYGSSVSISATPADGYSFNGWTKTAGTIANASSASTTFTVPASTATVTANFVLTGYLITVTKTGQGTVYGEGRYAQGTVVSINAIPANGYKFSGWTCTTGTIANPNSAETTYTVGSANATVTASFTKESYTVTVTKSPSEGGTVTGGGTAEFESSVAITATPASYYKFSKWICTNGYVQSQSASTNFIVPAGNATVTAIFESTLRAIPVPTGDITWTTASGKITLNCNMVKTSETGVIRTTPAVIKIRLGKKA